MLSVRTSPVNYIHLIAVFNKPKVILAGIFHGRALIVNLVDVFGSSSYLGLISYPNLTPPEVVGDLSSTLI